jgi:pyruvate dehydrogenase E1 component alpha subunit
MANYVGLFHLSKSFVQIDGNNVLAVREGMKLVKEYCGAGNGPMYVEFDTYRYHGHSMSDPGTVYRSRDEVVAQRESRDPIDYVKKLLLDHEFYTEKELKEIEKEVKKGVDASAKLAAAMTPPPPEELYTDIYADGKGGSELPPFVRMPDPTKSIGAHPFLA